MMLSSEIRGVVRLFLGIRELDENIRLEFGTRQVRFGGYLK